MQIGDKVRNITHGYIGVVTELWTEQGIYHMVAVLCDDGVSRADQEEYFEWV